MSKRGMVIAGFLILCIIVCGCAKKESAAEAAEEAAETTEDIDSSQELIPGEDVEKAEDKMQQEAAEKITTDYRSCDYMTIKEINDIIGNVYFKVRTSPMDPAGCSILWQSKEVLYKFYYGIREYPTASEARTTIGKFCKDTDTQPSEYTSEVGDLSCIREAQVISYERDFFFVKGNKLVQVGIDTQKVGFDKLIEAGKLIESRI